MADDAWYSYVYNIILHVQNKYPATQSRFIWFEKIRYIDNQKVQVADEIKLNIWKYPV